MKSAFKFLVFVSVLLLQISFSFADTYQIDSSRSSLTFKIRHFFSKAEGTFRVFDGTITVHPDNMETNEVSAEIDVNSIDTQSKGRDKDLRSPNYFDIAQFPKMVFKSKSWKKTGENEFDVTGDLTLHGITQEVILHAKLLSLSGDVSSWEAHSSLSKSRFGMTKSGKLLGDEVEISIQIIAKK